MEGNATYSVDDHGEQVERKYEEGKWDVAVPYCVYTERGKYWKLNKRVDLRIVDEDGVR